MPLVFIDVETNGMSARSGSRIIEIGVVRVEGGKITAEYEQLIDPRRRIGLAITELTGITQAMCLGQPTFAQQAAAMLPHLRGAAIVGHNVKFDLGFLLKEMERSRICAKTELGRAPVFDTVRIARKRFGRGGNSLGVLSRRLGIQPDGEHRALADAKTTFLIFQELLSSVGGWDLTLADIFLQQGKATYLEHETEEKQLAEPVAVVPELQLSTRLRV